MHRAIFLLQTGEIVRRYELNEKVHSLIDCYNIGNRNPSSLAFSKRLIRKVIKFDR
jgi:hypothetical protein